MKFREELPCNCPPTDAEDTDCSRMMYRLIRGEIPTEEDFHSLRKRKPKAQFKTASDKCNATGISLFSDPNWAKKRTSREMKNFQLCRLRLQKGAGKIVKSYGPHHYTWWPSAEVDILRYCEIQHSD